MEQDEGRFIFGLPCLPRVNLPVSCVDICFLKQYFLVLTHYFKQCNIAMLQHLMINRQFQIGLSAVLSLRAERCYL